ncbi:MAG: hypothetical protein LKE85_03685 [Lachnospiraceae bacterium]|jgi:ABC-type glycerol-3-phosphate transport system permease component|nr:hypothetical protein [Lachnospiraceae bacterium]
MSKTKTIKRDEDVKEKAGFFTYLIIVIIGIVLLFPIIWMFFATFKDNAAQNRKVFY